MADRRCVIVVGFPRSGTSWLAKCLSFAPDFTYYREPDNFDRVREAEQRFIYLYLTAEHDDLAYRRLMIRACAGEVATAFTMREDPGPLLALLGRRGRALGERQKAMDSYQFVVDVWRRADPELQPFVVEARNALTRLTRE